MVIVEVVVVTLLSWCAEHTDVVVVGASVVVVVVVPSVVDVSWCARATFVTLWVTC